MTIVSPKLTTNEKIDLFMSFFTGLTNVYGRYDIESGRSWQEKRPVTKNTIHAHLKGEKHYGVYLLVKDTIRAIVADFDNHDPSGPLEFIQAAKHYSLPAHIEVSKSKGYHVWIFFQESGVKAYKARLVVKFILDHIDSSQTEVFPKQDFLGSRSSYGNFIYTPLFGRLVPEGRTVFVDPLTMQPFQNQWDFLKSIHKVQESALDDIIEANNISKSGDTEPLTDKSDSNRLVYSATLPLCIQNMLQNGVSRLQRSSCFRLAVQLRRIGLPFDATVSVLKTWAFKNKPEDEKKIITDREIMEQASYAYRKYYQAYGCESPEMAPFCHEECHLLKNHRKREESCRPL